MPDRMKGNLTHSFVLVVECVVFSFCVHNNAALPGHKLVNAVPVHKVVSLQSLTDSMRPYLVFMASLFWCSSFLSVFNCRTSFSRRATDANAERHRGPRGPCRTTCMSFRLQSYIISHGMYSLAFKSTHGKWVWRQQLADHSSGLLMRWFSETQKANLEILIVSPFWLSMGRHNMNVNGNSNLLPPIHALVQIRRLRRRKAMLHAVKVAKRCSLQFWLHNQHWGGRMPKQFDLRLGGDHVDSAVLVQTSSEDHVQLEFGFLFEVQIQSQFHF